ncbi:hypothetical protein TNCT_388381 [Trichonephila clavata]|uniref:Uncharacterized protein n=1 Tax=Trichonephila clavata TaxID=2740835 RepID=A0A8X6KN18_TRICU|nr:hypothetical protein TNCT_388381 [Trichonephila clavata]
MKFLIVLLFAVLAVASAQRYLHPILLPFHHRGGDDEYAASLGGADEVPRLDCTHENVMAIYPFTDKHQKPY